MAELFPEIEAFKTERLKVDETHELYVEQSGNPQGEPVVFLHGGPGGWVFPKIRRLFDPDHYHIIAFDQRGAGQSTPLASLEKNTTWDLIADIEMIRERYGIKKWKVVGGSWGTTLALSYAIAHPEAVTSLLLRAIFLCRKQDIDWLYQRGADALFPDSWIPYRDAIAPEKRGQMVEAYYEELTSGDEERTLKAAQAWSQWEASASFLHVNHGAVEMMAKPEIALPFARIECHYFKNGCFFETDNHIIENVDKIRHIPATIIHGRYDVVCPLNQAWDLHQAWPEAELQIMPTSGHSAFEPEILEAQLKALEALKINEHQVFRH